MNLDELNVTRKHYVEEVAVFFEQEGMPRMYGRVLGYLLICDPPQKSSAELADALQASRGAISTATRALLQIGLISRAPRPGSRAMYFEIQPDALDHVLHGAGGRIRIGRELSERGLALLKETGADPQRLAALHSLYVFLGREFPALIERWDQHRKEQK